MRIAGEAPLHVSNVALVDPEDGLVTTPTRLMGVAYRHVSSHRKPCRVSYKYTEEGEKVRVSRRSGRIIPKAAELLDRKDFKSRSGYAGEC